jgi:hypothetical protein
MRKTPVDATISQAEIDQRSRESRRRLENVEALLVPRIRTTRSWLNLCLNPLLRCRPSGLLSRHRPTLSSKY